MKIPRSHRQSKEIFHYWNILNFATNTLGTFMLTSGLLPLLEQSDQPRVVTVSSGGMLVQKLDVTDLQFEQVRGQLTRYIQALP